MIIGFVFYKDYDNKLTHFHQSTIKLLEHTLDTTLNTFEMANDDFHSEHAYAMAKLTHKANNASKEERDIVRKKLMKLYMPFFSAKKLHSLEGMHIFDKNGHSLLRLHQPNMNDDPIINVRTSLKDMIKDFSYKEGFEIGVYKVSYRFQYPLFYDGDFVGSYEYSLPFNTLKKEMKEFFAMQYTILYNVKDMSKVILPKIIEKDYQKINIYSNELYFQPSSFQHEVEEKHFNHIVKMKDLKKALDSTDNPHILQYTFNGENFDLIIQPVLDITKKHIGYLLVHAKDEHTNNLKYELLRNIFMASLLSFMIFLFIVKQMKHKKYIRELINRQQDILVVTDGRKIKDANSTLVEFFGYKTLKEFESNNNCICDFFIKGKAYLQKNNDGLIWTEYILKYPNKKHRVQMQDISDYSIKTFELEYEVLKELNYILIIFKDVTDSLQKYNLLMNRANYDTLTSIYNRRSFDYYLSKELEISSQSRNIFSLIMFDIDHFKSVNDNYGHDVGDSVIKELTSLVSSHIRDIDIFARWGGEEFMIISNINIDISEVFAEKLRKMIDEHDFKHVRSVTCSFGVTQYSADDTKESIVKRCDKALYNAKESGRNKVSVE